MLVADAGNSSVKFAVVKSVAARPRIVATVDNADLTAAKVRAIAKKSGAVTSAGACVVPGSAVILRAALPHIAMTGPRSRMNFPTPVDRRTIGADRLANMAEAVRRHGENVIVADFGTAATFDLLDARGRFAGGAIAPGLRMLASALSLQTALLPAASLSTPRRLAGRCTKEALRAGVAGGYAGLVLHLIAGLAAASGGTKRPRIIFTGGDARTVARLARCGARVDPFWTLRGIAVLGELALRAKR